MTPEPGSYAIADEPTPSAYAHTVVSPMLTLIAFMVAGTGFGFAWMCWNGVAMGSATRRREIGLAIAGVLATLVVTFGAGALVASRVLPPASGPYFRIAIRCVPLFVAYRVHLLQSRSFELHRHFGGHVAARGWLGVVVLAYAHRELVARADGLSRLLLSL